MNKEIEEILNYMKQYVENIYEHDSEPMLNYKDLQIVLSYIEQLEEENKKLQEEKDHYKHLYSEVKKQKDEIKKYIKSFEYYIPKEHKTELLRMLGEIDD